MNKKDSIRRRIQLLSLPLFVKYGYNGVTMDQIAEAVGIAKSTIYYSHFKGKLEIAKSILVDEMKHFLSSMNQLSEDDSLEPTDIGRNMINAWFTSLKENNLFWQMVFRSMAEPQLSEIVIKEYREIYEQITETTALLFTQSGTADPHKRATLLLATIDGMMYQSLFFNRIPDLEGTKEYLIQIYKI
ncbi:MAG: TetR/AcrR family transcriptional regulator [Candidatus Heimdallarchaeota archaeon]|nr:TetR/AcrR family transcriptional regulator [Candidatus Heimdallarchaeota archaeon]